MKTVKNFFPKIMRSKAKEIVGIEQKKSTTDNKKFMSGGIFKSILKQIK